MAGGFSFCGTDIEDIGLEYAPELEDTYVYKTAKARIHEEVFDGHNGGYYYGISHEPKEFILRCIFQDQEIDQGLMGQILHLFREGRSGKLVFDRRPWCWYYATVSELDITGITNYLNGVIKVTMKAYYPYARSDLFTVKRGDVDYYRIIANSACLPPTVGIPDRDLCKDGPLTTAKEFLLFNPGDVYAPVSIMIAGDVGKGVNIINHTTGQTCRFVAMSSAEFDGENYLYVDGLSGKTVTVKDGVKKANFLYHDQGFIFLKPSFPATRDVQASCSDGEVIVHNKLFDRNRGETREWAEDLYKGQFIWLMDGWHEIVSVGKEMEYEDKSYFDEHRITVSDNPQDSQSVTTVICPMNRLSIEPESTMNITKLEFVYHPTYS